VYIVPAEPYGWIVLAGLLLVLWLKGALTRRRLPPNPDVELPGEPPRRSDGDFSEFQAAMKAMGFKAGEIKTRWDLVDHTLPLEQQIRQAVKQGN
jgi:hypothetical protein